ncbi:MAG: class I SAM-dependent methyltransferase, partial [Dehalococcoidia bacterium]
NMKGHKWFAAIFDAMSRSEERGFLGEMRRQLLGDLSGDVLEIGAGTGANFGHYPAGVRVTALEPDPYMLRRAQTKLAALGRSDITLHQSPAERIPFPDASFDTVVSTLVLCTVDDVPRSLGEIRRVLRPGGEFRFIEHVRGTGFVGHTQDLIKPVWGWCGAGCHPNRRTEDALRTSGFDVVIAERRKMMGFVPLVRGASVLSTAPGKAR